MRKLKATLNKLGLLTASTALFGLIGYAGAHVGKGMEFDADAHGIMGMAYKAGNLIFTLMGDKIVGMGLILGAVFGGIYAAIAIIRYEGSFKF